MTREIKVLESEQVAGQYNMLYTIAIIDHGKHGRLLLCQGFGGMSGLEGGAYRWRHGLACKLQPTDTISNLRQTQATDNATLLEAVRTAHDDARPMLEWDGSVISKLADAAGL